MRLGTKFNLMVTMIVLLALGFTSLNQIQVQRQLARAHLLDNSRTQGELLAMIAPDAMLGYDFILLNEYIAKITQHPDVAFAAIIDSNGRAVTSYIEPSKPALLELDLPLASPDIPEIGISLIANEQVLMERIPIEQDGRPLGELLIATDPRRIDGTLAAMTLRQLMLYAGIIIMISLAISLLFRIEVLRPIRQLMKGANRVAEGDFEQPIESYSEDELGTLTEAFNSMMEEVKFEREQLDYHANYDLLTTLPNRKMAMERIDYEIERAKRECVGFALIFIDLDNFKHVNDSLGHTVGDKLLRKISKRFKEQTRSVDLLARLGGDEFLLLITHCDSHMVARAAAERLLQSTKTPVSIEGHELHVHCSIGVAFYPENGTNEKTLLAAADDAMYAAKADPVSAIHYFDESTEQVRQPPSLSDITLAH